MPSQAITRVQSAMVIIIVVAAVVAGAFMAMNQTGPTPASTQTGPMSVPNPDTITVETIGQPDSLDPATAYTIRDTPVTQNVYEQLLSFKGDKADQVVPWLASSYDMSPDGLTYTFHLQSGIKFTDGTPMDADAVYFSIVRTMMIDDPNGPSWSMLQVLRGGMNYSKQYNNAGPSAPNGYGDKYTQAEVNDLVNAKPIEVIDPQTVAFHLERRYAGWPFIMAFIGTAIISPTAFKTHWTAPTDGTGYIQGATGGDYSDQLNPWAGENMVGTGPYMLKSWDKASQVVVLTRNENYWGGPEHRGIAPVPNIIIKGVDDPNTRILDFKAGSCDILGIPTSISSQLPGGLIFEFADKDTWFSEHKLVSVSPDYQIFPKEGIWPQFSSDVIAFNQKIRGSDLKLTAFQPFADLRIRKAFTLSFNRTSYIHDVLQDFGYPATQMIPPGMFGYDPTIQQTPYDPSAAKELLLDAGAHPLTPDNAFSPKNPKTVEFSYILGYASQEAAATLTASTINNMAPDTGLSASVVGIAGPQLHVLRHDHRLQAMFLGWYVDYVDPDDFLVPYGSGTAGYFPPGMGYNDPNATDLIAQQATITDPAQRLQMISQIQGMVNNDYAYIWLSFGVAYSLSRPWIHERPNASLASGIDHYNQPINGYNFYEIVKSAQPPSISGATQPTVISIVQMPDTIIPKKDF